MLSNYKIREPDSTISNLYSCIRECPSAVAFKNVMSLDTCMLYIVGKRLSLLYLISTTSVAHSAARLTVWAIPML